MALSTEHSEEDSFNYNDSFKLTRMSTARDRNLPPLSPRDSRLLSPRDYDSFEAPSERFIPRAPASSRGRHFSRKSGNVKPKCSRSSSRSHHGTSPSDNEGSTHIDGAKDFEALTSAGLEDDVTELSAFMQAKHLHLNPATAPRRMWAKMDKIAALGNNKKAFASAPLPAVHQRPKGAISADSSAHAMRRKCDSLPGRSGNGALGPDPWDELEEKSVFSSNKLNKVLSPIALSARKGVGDDKIVTQRKSGDQTAAGVFSPHAPGLRSDKASRSEQLTESQARGYVAAALSQPRGYPETAASASSEQPSHNLRDLFFPQKFPGKK